MGTDVLLPVAGSQLPVCRTITFLFENFASSFFKKEMHIKTGYRLLATGYF
jgi:hypothetical protein